MYGNKLLDFLRRLRNHVHIKRLKSQQLARFRKDRKKFVELGGTVFKDFIILSDWDKLAGEAKGHYFHQDLLVAQFIHQRNPRRHIDVGSRIDGFGAHVAAFRKIEILDIRPLPDTGHSNISFLAGDLMKSSPNREGITDSLSCLHVLEHFGLGRYGDPIDPTGHIKGFVNLIKMLKKEGLLYLSFPIGLQTQVHFNAHRVFHFQEVLSWNQYSKVSYTVDRFDYVDDQGELHKQVELLNSSLDVKYGCGIYTIRRTA
jgi:hypothetical protein